MSSTGSNTAVSLDVPISCMNHIFGGYNTWKKKISEIWRNSDHF